MQARPARGVGAQRQRGVLAVLLAVQPRAQPHQRPCRAEAGGQGGWRGVQIQHPGAGQPVGQRHQPQAAGGSHVAAAPGALVGRNGPGCSGQRRGGHTQGLHQQRVEAGVVGVFAVVVVHDDEATPFGRPRADQRAPAGHAAAVAQAHRAVAVTCEPAQAVAGAQAGPRGVGAGAVAQPSQQGGVDEGLALEPPVAGHHELQQPRQVGHGRHQLRGRAHRRGHGGGRPLVFDVAAGPAGERGHGADMAVAQAHRLQQLARHPGLVALTHGGLEHQRGHREAQVGVRKARARRAAQGEHGGVALQRQAQRLVGVVSAVEDVPQADVLEPARHVQQVLQAQRVRGLPGVVDAQPGQPRLHRLVQRQPALAGRAQQCHREERLGHRAHFDGGVGCQGLPGVLVGQARSAGVDALAIDQGPGRTGQALLRQPGLQGRLQGLRVGCGLGARQAVHDQACQQHAGPAPALSTRSHHPVPALASCSDAAPKPARSLSALRRPAVRLAQAAAKPASRAGASASPAWAARAGRSRATAAAVRVRCRR